MKKNGKKHKNNLEKKEYQRYLQHRRRSHPKKCHAMESKDKFKDKDEDKDMENFQSKKHCFVVVQLVGDS